MRRGPEVSGWAGSLFDEPIAPVAAPWASKPVDTFAGAAFRQPAPAVSLAKEPIAVLLNGKWYSEGKMLWDCSDCLCLDCANEGKSCHDCKGFEHCMKHGGKIGNCPDFRTEDGKEQHCLENGCLCFKCQLIGDNCEECPGPIRCDGPRMKCKEYVGAEVEA